MTPLIYELAATLAVIAAGSLLVLTVAGKRVTSALRGPRVVALGVLLGVPTIGGWYFLAQLAVPVNRWQGAVTVVGILLATVAAGRRVWKTKPWLAPGSAVGAGKGSNATKRGEGLLLMLGGVVLVAAASTVRWWAPYGWGQDGWAIWQLKARFVSTPTLWYGMFDEAVGFSHTSYPVGWPAALALIGRWSGHHSWSASLLLGLAIAFSILCIVSSPNQTDWSVRGKAAFLLLGTTPLFAVMAGSNCADLPLAGTIVAGVVALHETGARVRDGDSKAAAGWARLVALSGASAALLKNEGLPFAAMLLIALVTTYALGRRMVPFVSGVVGPAAILLVGLVPVVFVNGLAPGADVLLRSSSVHSVATAIAEPRRWALVAGAFWEQLLCWGGGVVPIAVILHWMQRRRRIGNGADLLLPTSVLACQYGVYALVFLVTPLNLDWHLRTALPRLYLHLVPAGLALLVAGWEGKGGLAAAERSMARRAGEE